MITVVFCIIVLAFYKIWWAVAVAVVFEIGWLLYAGPKMKKMAKEKCNKDRDKTVAIDLLRENYRDARSMLHVFKRVIEMAQDDNNMVIKTRVPEHMLNKEYPHVKIPY